MVVRDGDGDPQTRHRRVPGRCHGGDVYSFARARGIAPEEVLDFSASINPLGWPLAAKKAYYRALTRVVHYPEPYATTLTEELARYHGIDPAAILAGNGSTQFIYLLARALAAQRVLVVAPLFSEHEAAFRLSGARVERLLLRPPRFALSCERLGQALTNSYTALVLTNPNSPTGSLIPLAQGEEIARLCQRTRTVLIVDETFIDWSEKDSLKQHACQSPHVIVLRSLTKFFALPGLRVGYLIAHPRVVRRLRLQLEPWSVNTVAQEVARVCLRGQRFIQRSRSFMTRERAWLFRQLAALTGVRPFPSEANFLLVRVARDVRDASELARLLAERNLLVRVCENFPGLGRRFFRVAVRTRVENRHLLMVLREALAS